MEAKNFGREMSQLMASFGKPDADDDCKCSACSGETAVLTAIRAMSKVDTAHVYAILTCLASKMAQSGFSDGDIQMIDEAAGFVCGEQA